MPSRVVDNFDLKLIELLIKNSRTNVTNLAKTLHSSRLRVQKRINKLEKTGVIRYYPTIVDSRTIGYQILAYSDLKLTPGKISRVVKALSKLDEVIWVNELMGPYDINTIIYCKDMEEFRNFINIKLPEIPGIESTNSRLVINHYYRGKPIERTSQRKKSKTVNLDRLDHKIVKLLMANARSSYKEIGSKLHTSPQIISYRISRLEKMGIIKMYTAHLDFPKIGLNLTAILALKIQPKRFEDALKKIIKLKEVIWADETTGEYDLEIYTVVENRMAFRNFIRDKLGAIEGIREIQTSVVTFDHAAKPFYV